MCAGDQVHQSWRSRAGHGFVEELSPVRDVCRAHDHDHVGVETGVGHIEVLGPKSITSKEGEA